MTGADTNVLVRLLAADDPAQTRRSKNLFENHEVLIVKTVLLETEWVLRSAYGVLPQTIASAFRKLSRTAGVRLEDPEGVERTVHLYEHGIDFADAMHLISCRDAVNGFATFDRGFRKKAASLEGLPKVTKP